MASAHWPVSSRRESGEFTGKLVHHHGSVSALSSEDRSQAVKYLLGKELGRSGSIAIDPAMESQLTLWATGMRRLSQR